MNTLEETKEMLLVKRKSNVFSQARVHSNVTSMLVPAWVELGCWQDMVYGNGVAPRSPLGSYFEVRLGRQSGVETELGTPTLIVQTWKL